MEPITSQTHCTTPAFTNYPKYKGKDRRKILPLFTIFLIDLQSFMNEHHSPFPYFNPSLSSPSASPIQLSTFSTRIKSINFYSSWASSASLLIILIRSSTSKLITEILTSNLSFWWGALEFGSPLSFFAD